jgi:uncharacterized ferritin-like protein (DUF455 family)
VSDKCPVCGTPGTIHTSGEGTSHFESEMILERLVMWALEHGLATGHADTEQELLDHVGSQIEEMRERLHKIRQWCEAYPLDVFPEPDFKKAATVLKENGMTLDAISASNMRHVLNGIKSILDT